MVVVAAAIIVVVVFVFSTSILVFVGLVTQCRVLKHILQSLNFMTVVTTSLGAERVSKFLRPVQDTDSWHNNITGRGAGLTRDFSALGITNQPAPNVPCLAIRLFCRTMYFLFHGCLPLHPLWSDLLHISFRSTFYHIGRGGGYFFVLSKGMYAIGKNPFNGKPDSSLQKKKNRHSI